MIELKNSELEQALYIIATYDSKTFQLVSGLLKEPLTLGTKRKIQKIHKKLQKAYEQLISDIKEIQTEAGEDKQKADEEFKILMEEKVKIDEEPFQLSQIENISTSANYNFEIIEKLAI